MAPSSEDPNCAPQEWSGGRPSLGRRRRLFSVTDRGRKELGRCLDEPVEDVIGYRDLGLLKLVFGAVAEPGTIAELAAVQVVLRESRMRAARNPPT